VALPEKHSVKFMMHAVLNLISKQDNHPVPVVIMWLFLKFTA